MSTIVLEKDYDAESLIEEIYSQMSPSEFSKIVYDYLPRDAADFYIDFLEAEIYYYYLDDFQRKEMIIKLFGELYSTTQKELLEELKCSMI